MLHSAAGGEGPQTADSSFRIGWLQQMLLLQKKSSSSALENILTESVPNNQRAKFSAGCGAHYLNDFCFFTPTNLPTITLHYLMTEHN